MIRKTTDMQGNNQIEELVVGRLITEPSLLLQISISERYFTNAVNRAVFCAIRDSSQILKDGDDMHNVHQLGAILEGNGLYDKVGGLARLAEYYPSVGGTFYHNLKALKEIYNRRGMAHILAEGVQRLQADMPAEEVIDYLLPYLSRYSEIPNTGKTLLDAVKDEAEAIFEHIDAEERGEAPLIGIPTGVKMLDAIIGGLPIGVPSVIAARPGEGKSTLALCIADSVARRGIGVHLFSYEDGERSFSQRALAMRSDNNLAKIVQRKLSKSERMRLQGVKTDALERIVVERAHGYSARKVARAFRAQRRALGTRLVIIDYLQLMPGSDSRLATHEQIEGNMRDIAALAASEEIAVLVLSQLKREAQGVEPKLNDLRGSGSVEQIGKLVIALHAEHAESHELKFIVLKNYQGKRGYVYATYNRAECRIT